MNTRQAAIGYMCKALFNMGVPSKLMREFILKAEEEVLVELDNHSTVLAAVQLGTTMRFPEENIQELQRELYHCFDGYLVEEAEDFLAAFKVVTRIL